MSAHRIPLAVTGLATAVVLTACGGGTDRPTGSADAPATSAPATGADAADAANVTFAQQMTAHHQQALEMAELAAERAGSAAVRGLADRISTAQRAEIETMTGWLEDWGAEAPMPGSGHGGHDMGDMPGGMSAEEMDRLGGLTGTAFDREWLAMMIRHHQGAVEMAETERAEGADPDAVTLAGQVVTDQTAEVAEMQELLGSL